MIATDKRSNINITKHRTCKNYSVLKSLRKENKSNEYFEIMLSNITLEDLIALKLELTYRSIGVALYGVPLWRSLHHIIREALLKYIVSISNSKNEAARYIGVDNLRLLSLLKKYNIDYYFIKGKINNATDGATNKEDLSKY